MVSVCLCKVFAKGASSVMMKTRETKPYPPPPPAPAPRKHNHNSGNLSKISGDGGSLLSDITRQFSILFHGSGGGDKKNKKQNVGDWQRPFVWWRESLRYGSCSGGGD